MAHEYDEVNRPKHYASGKIECIEAIEAALTPEELKGFLKGNIIKYTWRERHKGGVQSLEKAQWYLNRLLGTDLPPMTAEESQREAKRIKAMEAMREMAAPRVGPDFPTLHTRRVGDVIQGAGQQKILKTLGAALKDDLDAYDKVEAYYSKRGFEE